MINLVISEIWSKLIEQVNIYPDKFSSEKSIVFHFAWMLKENLQSKIHSIDFEKQLYENFSGGKFLDLYFEVDEQKIGIEFKYPKSTKNSAKLGNSGNSNQTQTRIKVINDIKRLSYLINDNRIDYGFFLMLTNEKPYIFTGYKKNIAIEFQTYSDVIYKTGITFPIDSINSKETVTCLNDVVFRWNGIEQNKILDKVAWIDPISIYK